MTQSVRSENRGKDFYPLEGYKPKPYRFTINDLERMIEAGIIREGTRVELMEAELLEIHRSILGSDYLEKVTLFPGQTARPLKFPEVEVHWDVVLIDSDSTELETTQEGSSG